MECYPSKTKDNKLNQNGTTSGTIDVIDNILLLDSLTVMYVIGSTIDYITELGGSFLTVVNPTAKSSCGCGESFAV